MEGERAILCRGLGLSPKSNGKALKVQSWGNDMHSLVLLKNPPVMKVHQGLGLEQGLGSERPGGGYCRGQVRKLEQGRGWWKRSKEEK